MKSLVTFLLLLITSISFAQKISTKPFKGATKIILSDSISANENFKMAGQLLIDAGYFIEKKDLEYLTIESQPISVSPPGAINYSQTIFIIAKDKSVVILTKGKKTNGSLITRSERQEKALDFLPWRNDDLEEICFKNMTTIASKFPNSKITYSE